MLSVEHQAVVDLFHKCAPLGVELLRRFTEVKLDAARIEVKSGELGEATSTDYRADAVLLVHDSNGKPRTGVIVEVQRGRDADKRVSWPAYVTNLRAEFDCPAILLVVALTQTVARWARRPIETGHPGFCLTPLVIGPGSLSETRSNARASKLPELTVLSALLRPDLASATAAISAAPRLRGLQSGLYVELILKALPAESRRILEARMDADKVPLVSKFAREAFGRGLKKGREQGREEGRQESKEALRVAAAALARSKLARTRRVRGIDEIDDSRVLEELVVALGKAESAEQARDALKRAMGSS